MISRRILPMATRSTVLVVAGLLLWFAAYAGAEIIVPSTGSFIKGVFRGPNDPALIQMASDASLVLDYGWSCTDYGKGNPKEYLSSIGNSSQAHDPSLQYRGVISTGCSASGWCSSETMLQYPTYTIANVASAGFDQYDSTCLIDNYLTQGLVYQGIQAYRHIPFLLITYENDGFDSPPPQGEYVLHNGRAVNAPWCHLALPGIGHCDPAQYAIPNQFTAKWLSAVVPLRTRSQKANATSAVAFDTIDIASGWLGTFSLSGNRPVNPAIAAYADFTFDKSKASWFPNQEVAQAWLAIVGGKPDTVAPHVSIISPSAQSTYHLSKVGDTLTITIAATITSNSPLVKVEAGVEGLNTPTFKAKTTQPWEFTWKVTAFLSKNPGGKEHYNLYVNATNSTCDRGGCPSYHVGSSGWVPIDIYMPIASTALSQPQRNALHSTPDGINANCAVYSVSGRLISNVKSRAGKSLTTGQGPGMYVFFNTNNGKPVKAILNQSHSGKPAPTSATIRTESH